MHKLQILDDNNNIVGNNIGVTITTRDYRPGIYNFTASATDIFGQMARHNFTLPLTGSWLIQR